jgi:tetratricopeptide (TPR) repeat protein
MKEIFKILVLFISIPIFSQNEVSSFEQDLYDRALFKIDAVDYLDIQKVRENESLEVVKFVAKMEEKATNEAMELFQKILDTLPNTILLNKINYTKARLYNRQGDYKSAVEYYSKVLENPQFIKLGDEDEENYTRKNICIWLAEILIKTKDYENALKYLDESKKYKITHMCGNAAIDDGKKLDRLYSICKIQIKKKK